MQTPCLATDIAITHRHVCHDADNQVYTGRRVSWQSASMTNALALQTRRTGQQSCSASGWHLLIKTTQADRSEHISRQGLNDCDVTPVTLSMQEELDRRRAASPRARTLPRGIYGAAALQRIDLIRSQTISPHRRKVAYEVLDGLTAFAVSCAASLHAQPACSISIIADNWILSPQCSHPKCCMTD